MIWGGEEIEKKKILTEKFPRNPQIIKGRPLTHYNLTN